MDDLVTFLRVRLDEREEVATQVAKGPVLLNLSRRTGKATFRRYLDTNTPEFILVDVDAKRQIIDELAPIADGVITDAGEQVVAENVLARLALPYASHPDYRLEWKP
ncbi:DUF6221 family protein [Amycolatopsis palatopharyngis]|uniref:DUF6221 family protein n=1 Tax=Amycolatopsis palatopharyngis TaxID=187982 RepID=UPI000E24D0DB|nr:DUF6221 family protein [Amycolatopsis palatopharyngis]